MSAPLSPQAALETAVRDAIRAQLGYKANECERTFDAQPYASAGEVFVAVWSGQERTSDSRMALDERYNVAVSVTVRLPRLPRDRWIIARDDLVIRLDAIRALIHRDSFNHAVKNAANLLAGLGTADNRHVGFSEALAFTGMDRLQVVPASWFSSTGQGEAGVMQTANFGRARLIQAMGSAR